MEDQALDTASKLDPGDGFGPYPTTPMPYIEPRLPDYILDMGPNDYISGWGGEPTGRKEAEKELEMSAQEMYERYEPLDPPPNE